LIVHVKRGDLLPQARKTAAAAVSGGTLEILRGMRIDADSRAGIIRLTAANLEVSIQTVAYASVDQPGGLVMDAKLFLSILEKLPEDEIYLELKKDVLRIQSGKAVYEVAAMPGKFPVPELPLPGNTVSVTGLKSLVRKTVFAAAKEDEPRAALKCVRLSLTADGLLAAAANGFCLAETDGDRDCRGKISLLIPAEALRLLAAVCTDSDVFDLGITGDGGKAVVFYDGILLFTARLIDGAFIDAERVFDSFKPVSEAAVSVSALKESLHAIRACSETDRCGVAFEASGVRLTSGDDGASGSAIVEGVVIGAGGKTRFFNAAHLSDYIRALSGDVTLRLSAEGNLTASCGGTRYFQICTREKTASAGKTKKEIKKYAA
jgi:DNA polymerase-3 subunit beta